MSREQVKPVTISYKRLYIPYFSGTGGARLVAETFADAAAERGYAVSLRSLDARYLREDLPRLEEIISDTDIMILVYAVHAIDAPRPVYTWIEALPDLTQLEGVPSPSVMVVSVSGGGEIWPNNHARITCILALERKGYRVDHEHMIPMPTNWTMATHDHTAARLLRVLPEEVSYCIDRIEAGTRTRTAVERAPALLSWIIRREKAGSHLFGEHLRIDTEACTECGWCTRNCPMDNILSCEGETEPGESEARIAFGNDCILCLRCVYGCPEHAIYPTLMKFMVVKSGFSLEAIEERTRGIELLPVSECSKGLLWKGVREYLAKYREL